MYVPCKYCRAPITFATASGGRWIPINPDGSEHERGCAAMRRERNRRTRAKAEARKQLAR